MPPAAWPILKAAASVDPLFKAQYQGGHNLHVWDDAHGGVDEQTSLAYAQPLLVLCRELATHDAVCDCINLLLRSGADAKAADGRGWTIYHHRVPPCSAADTRAAPSRMKRKRHAPHR